MYPGPGQWKAAEREVRVARWLAGYEVPTARLAEVAQPIEAEGHPVTFWPELPAHRHGSHSDVAQLLTQLHPFASPGFRT